MYAGCISSCKVTLQAGDCIGCYNKGMIAEDHIAKLETKHARELIRSASLEVEEWPQCGGKSMSADRWRKEE